MDQAARVATLVEEKRSLHEFQECVALVLHSDD
jgi:hypothetical protein